MKVNRTFLLLSLCFYSVFSYGCVSPVVNEGIGMFPTLKNGDKFFITDVNEIGRGDIILFQYPKDTNKRFIKRVIGLPNEKVEIKNGIVFINSKKLDEPYIDSDYNQASANLATEKIPENNYFVLGDNRDNSSDSRIWGTVSKELINGKFWYKYADAEKK